MSFHFYLYRAPPDSGPMTRWEQMFAEPLGTVAEVRDRLASLFPQVRWTRYAPPPGARCPVPVTMGAKHGSG